MIRFVVRIFAVIGFIVVVFGIIGGAVQSYQRQQAAKEPNAIILNIDFDHGITEQNEPSALPFTLSGGDNTSLFDILRALDRAKDDVHVKGIVARFGGTEPSIAHVQEITAALQKFKTSGKFTYAFGPSYGEFGLGNRTYFLASAFDTLWLQPTGTVSLTGLGLVLPFGKAGLDKIGVSADFMQREEYKSFMDMATRDSAAPPVRENMQSIISSLGEQEAKGIADNRHMTVDQVKDLMTKGPYTDAEAVKAGLVNKLGYLDDLDDELKKKAGADVQYLNPAAYLSLDLAKLPEPKAKVALIFGAGMIMDHESGGINQVSGENTMGADVVGTAFNAAANDKDVKAILFRIDSGGGSPSASETIRRAVVMAQKKGKPVFVSMGDTAASGGYWIAMNADQIIAEPGTLTGSIGVVSGKFSAKELMQKIGVTAEIVRTSDNAGMWMPLDRFNNQQRERVNALMDNTYKAFTDNVAAARKIAPEKMPDIAKGRVWTGAQAASIGLVDQLGGIETALSAIRKNLKLADSDHLFVQTYPPAETTVERIQRLLQKFGVEGAMMGSLFTTLHQLQITFAPWLSAMDTTHQAVSARMTPMAIH